ncbi:MAG: hypothetical protein ACRBBP_11455 [Bdellovibrionales bacterium]
MKKINLIILLSLLFTGCVTASGKGQKAEEAYKVCAKLITAIEEYKLKNHKYPRSLDDLTPNFIKSYPKLIHRFPITFTSSKSDGLPPEQPYILGFQYVEFGLNSCKYLPTQNEWDCYGAL